MSSESPNALELAMRREIPLLTQEQVSERQNEFYAMRSAFCAWCSSRQFYYTLALLSTAELQMSADLPAIAAVSITDRIKVMFHPLAIDLWKQNAHDAYFLFVHELRHFVQIANMDAVASLVDLTPIRDVFAAKLAEATNPDAQQIWQKAIDEIDDPESKKWKAKRHQIANITMDAALHQDLGKLLPNSIPRVNTFMKTVYVPYSQGRSFRTIAQDSFTAGTQQEFFDSICKNFGPIQKKEINDLLAKSGDLTVDVLAHAQSMNVHLQTVDSLEDQYRNLEHYQPTLRRDCDWIYLADEHVKWLAAQIDENNDANNPQGSGTDGSDSGDSFAQFDSHDFADAEQSQEQKERSARLIRDALRRAEAEGKVMAHQAGAGVGDQEMIGDASTQLADSIKRAMDALKLKFLRIFSDSNNKRYTHERVNRLFPYLEYIPGQKRERKRLPQVVLVLDTSGSMYSPMLVNQMLAMARKLHREGKLAAMYYCDTVLHKVNFTDAASQKVIGGGGTELSVSICEDIMARENLAKGWELVYATDTYCPGLPEAQRDRRWKIHVVDVPKLLATPK